MARWHKLHVIDQPSKGRTRIKHVLETWEGRGSPPPNWLPPGSGRLLAILFKEDLLRRLSKQPPEPGKETEVGARQQLDALTVSTGEAERPPTRKPQKT
jgi:hypothetical protein